jgi:CRP-like cAMP-binding protein
MSLESDVKRMAGASPFHLLPREALQLLAFSCEKRAFKKGDTLFTQGDSADGGFLVLEGEVALSADGAERRAGPGALIGETALVAEVSRGATATAASDVSTLTIARPTFRRVLSEFPEAAVKVRALAAARTGKLFAALETVRVREFGGRARRF